MSCSEISPYAVEANFGFCLFCEVWIVRIRCADAILSAYFPFRITLSVWRGARLFDFACLIEVDLEEVARLHEEALPDFREAGYVWGIFTCLTNVAPIRLARGETDRAEALFKELLPLSQESGDVVARLHAIFGLACAASAEGDLRRAAGLWGAAHAMQEKAGTRLPPITLSFTEYERRLAETRAHLGEPAFEEAWTEGVGMSEEEATAYALKDESPVSSSLEEQRAPATVAPALTGREKQVAAYVARGLSNREIARELHLSERTVHAHLRSILKKLDLRSREQVGSRLTSL
jgi:DNA-binding CsgD family transcriptional regulator